MYDEITLTSKDYFTWFLPEYLSAYHKVSRAAMSDSAMLGDDCREVRSIMEKCIAIIQTNLKIERSETTLTAEVITREDIQKPVCSNCGQVIDKHEINNYCHYCGAKLV